jgi:hybrid cluster-associated redox disulfide protein
MMNRRTIVSEVITADCLVQDVVERHPQTISVLNQHGFLCVGCYISPYHTIADCAREHAMSVEPLVGELNQAVAS